MVVATAGVSLPEVRQTLSLSEIEAGSLFSVIFVSASLGSAVAGRLSDKIGRKTVMVMGVSILASGFALSTLTVAYPVIVTFLAIAGIGYGFTTPSLYTLMSDLGHRTPYLRNSESLSAYPSCPPCAGIHFP